MVKYRLGSVASFSGTSTLNQGPMSHGTAFHRRPGFIQNWKIWIPDMAIRTGTHILGRAPTSEGNSATIRAAPTQAIGRKYRLLPEATNHKVQSTANPQPSAATMRASAGAFVSADEVERAKCLHNHFTNSAQTRTAKSA